MLTLKPLNTMKRIFTFLVVLCSVQAFATDLFVEPFALAPAFSTIGAAVEAAENGDRIIIKNDVGGTPYIEDITISKSLEFLSADADTFFVVQGDYTIEPSGGDIVVSIISMNNLNGDIISSAGGVARTEVNIMDSYLQNGEITLDDAQIYATITGTSSGSVSILHGRIIGSTIEGDLFIENDLSGAATQDTLQVIASKINGQVQLNSSVVYYQLLNNLIRETDQFVGTALIITEANTNGNVVHQIYGNTISVAGRSSGGAISGTGIRVSETGAAIIEFMNNIVDIRGSVSVSLRNNTRAVIPSNGSAVLNFFYNVIDSDFGGVLPVTGAEFGNSEASIDNVPVSGIVTVGIDLANPDPTFNDLDLTRGDVGAFGGSFTLDNYFPLFQGSARVFHVNVNRRIRRGNTLTIQAEAYDR